MTAPGLPPPKPIPLKDRSSLVFVERAQLDVLDGAFVAVNADGTRTQIPVGGSAGIMLEPAARISHAAVVLAARVGKLDMSPDRAVRLACRDIFRQSGLLARMIPQFEDVLSAGELPRPEPPPEALGPAFRDEEAGGDAGHRG